MFDPATLRLCLVTDRSLARGRPLSEVVAACIAGGITMVQLREKDADTRTFLDLARALKTQLAGSSIPLVINDRVDIALAVGADGVHVGQKDMPIAQVRALMPQAFVGLSITNAAHITRADAQSADYLGIGPLFQQTTKADASTPLGIAGFAALRAMSTKPVIAIGGIKAEHAGAIMKAGAQGIAVVSALMSADHPEKAARAFRTNI
jgi:thiamine-phosphate pyrophosphorylase